ncbi:HET-domain-containing protein, partial [Thozetella sp. PMI_491]
MWLINTLSLQLEFTSSPELQPYAILSHTWEDEEVTFQDMADLRCARKKKGFAKIERTCYLAIARGINFAWVDTCCINKESSAELTESINSMFAWYKTSSVCFTFLADLPVLEATEQDWLDRSFLHCRWFTRGWTFQELIAPEILEFYDCEWQYRSTKEFLREEISDITGVDEAVLEKSSLLYTIPVAKRFSWAASRETTREEDRAYSLLGIFDVNMPMIYGEGAKAFIRLQEEILKQTNDLTIFAWTSYRESRKDFRPLHLDSHNQPYRGILANSPLEFTWCRKVERIDDYLASHTEFSMTNNGLRIDTFLAMGTEKDYILNLDAYNTDKYTGIRSRVGVRLIKTPGGFVRHFPDRLFKTTDPLIWEGKYTTVYIRKTVTPEESQVLQARNPCSIGLRYQLPTHYSLESISVRPQKLWDPHKEILHIQAIEDFTAYFDLSLTE